MVLNKPIMYSDHCAIILDINPQIEKVKPLFKTKSFWFPQEFCLNLIQTNWSTFKNSGLNRDLSKCLENLKNKLISWDKIF